MISPRAYLDSIGERDLSAANIKDIGDDFYVLAKPLMFHWTLILGEWSDRLGYIDRWCYATEELALNALRDFPRGAPEGYEPSGWHRHPNSGRRRPDGVPGREYTDR